MTLCILLTLQLTSPLHMDVLRAILPLEFIKDLPDLRLRFKEIDLFSDS